MDVGLLRMYVVVVECSYRFLLWSLVLGLLGCEWGIMVERRYG